MQKKLLLLSLALTIMPTLVYAEGNIAEGKTKAASCASCHGDDGNSMVPTFPKLAGQHADYLANQLYAFKENARNSPMMVPLAMGLDRQSIQDIAAYYASQKISTNQLPVLESDEDEDDSNSTIIDNNSETLDDLMALGSDLYRNGNLKTNGSACIACHGPSAEGNKPSAFPALHSQHADYLIKSLTDFKKGIRNTQPDNMMSMIARKMTDKEIQAVSYYVSMIK